MHMHILLSALGAILLPLATAVPNPLPNTNTDATIPVTESGTYDTTVAAGLKLLTGTCLLTGNFAISAFVAENRTCEFFKHKTCPGSRENEKGRVIKSVKGPRRIEFSGRNPYSYACYPTR